MKSNITIFYNEKKKIEKKNIIIRRIIIFKKIEKNILKNSVTNQFYRKLCEQ